MIRIHIGWQVLQNSMAFKKMLRQESSLASILWFELNQKIKVIQFITLR